MAYGSLTVRNFTNLDIKVRAHRRGKRPKEFNVSARSVTRHDSLRVGDQDIGNFERDVDIHDARTGNRLLRKSVRYKVVEAYEALTVLTYVGGTYTLDQVDILPGAAEKDLEEKLMEDLKLIVSNGLSCFNSDEDDLEDQFD
jgi:hypothetical protein